ncbi:hypothetical protein JKF63_01618 [Porcisia hertigi]|uniref:DUF1935 domain-containing protein n=1 Tax=Porcisia hertigi TaxID=2761500 RepID=A0A836HIE9_9TRYP|nr:hypothetical protein JKF63_01618 [Porcisia hertigi]
MPHFENGQPTFDYDHVYRCFKREGNGLLFRLVDSVQKKWAFYNDTSDTIIQVKARFSPDCNIEKLNRARATRVPVGMGNQPDLCEVVVTLEVYPLATEPFIKGDVNGFELEFHTEQIPVSDVKFMNRHRILPRYDKVYKCFKNEGNGLFFRLVDEQEGKWYYYNDTHDFRMTATVAFPSADEVKPLGNTEMVPVQDGVNEVAYQITVDPGNTEVFIVGCPSSYHQAFNADPIDESCLDAMDVQYINGKPDSSIIDVSHCKVFKCFKGNGNGLLFRLVDERAGRWAFYNDTTEYVMRPTVRFFAGAAVMPGPDAQMSPDTRERDATVVTLEIPPCETRLFIEGHPTKYEVSVVADSLHRTAPESTEPFIKGDPASYTLKFAAEPVSAPAAPASENPVRYLNGSPDPAVIPHQTHVFKCFKEHSNGLLFRIVDDVNTIWAFYNDTVDYVMTAKMRCPDKSDVQFAPGVQVTANAESEGGVIAAVEVLPLATVPFLVGAPAQYELTFAATPVTVPALSPATPAGPNAVQRPAGAMGPAVTPPPMPEPTPAYVHSGPDLTVMPRFDEVYRCFKEHGNGLLFRLVDKAQRRWAFYNDTPDVVASVKVEFPPDARIQPLGHTVLGRNPETGAVLHELRVNPLETALFVEGDVDAFTTKFVAERVQTRWGSPLPRLRRRQLRL